ncbi:NAD(+) synthase [Planctomycetes bacterium K23_9]|uniref:Glutamine-dependent NAD(+) synthetase n=1 Tax=Stieleria marina TaxID=1930275 RepID=A0A517P2M9_9BACT|nr:Glutamine-dependent NAD(+) synthetase [Planctomycetes bacterium K23_9]
MYPHGIFRITAASPSLSVANPIANAKASMQVIDSSDADLILLPELGLTGYTCGDLFGSDALLDGALEALAQLADHSRSHRKIVVAGLPLAVAGSLMNVAALVANGKVMGIVPKTFLPTYREFYEGRHFRGAGISEPELVTVLGHDLPFGTDLLFQSGDATIAIEICEDLWTPLQPSSYAAVAGANVLLNLSASNETIGKANWRRDLVRSQSGRCIAAYAYASSGAGESTSDLVFGGHCMIAENGGILGESRRVGDGLEPAHFDQSSVTCDVDLQRLAHDRRVVGSFDDVRDRLDRQFRLVELRMKSDSIKPRNALARRVDAHPFVPDESAELDARCAEIFSLQAAGLIKRLTRLPDTLPLTIGVSGGLDSTLALLVAIRAVDSIGRDRKCIHGVTMPGFGTSEHTRTSADRLIEATGITGDCIDIRQLCLDTFRGIDHKPLGIDIDETTTAESLHKSLQDNAQGASDLTFENVQARVRTMLLMSRGFVLGTGDMSEQALGWCTYNADHISMYNVNTSIPKTLVRFLVRYAADNYFGGELKELLHRVADTPISPELMPTAADGTILQDTEAVVGAYELHDFFLYHFVRNGFSRDKILYLAEHAKFKKSYSNGEVAETLDTFIRRFFGNQFKRNCVPDGPKVGSVSLSPRGDWRMPSDADADAF